MKIVVVEDNEILAKSIAKVLVAEGHAARCFSDGREAYSFLMIEKGAVDLAIVDYMLPGMDGVSLIAALREAGVSIPFLMLTARSDVHDKVRGLKSGADYYLTKPFEFDELLACIEALRRRPEQYQQSILEIAPKLTFLPDTHTLVKEGVVVPLTPTEAGILEYLLRNRGKIISQHELSEHVFDFAKENWSNTVEVHIKNIRKKLAHPSYENPIKTIRGRGYRMEI
jgi:DNA-binding response OmpR family regulator